ncbi:hypothetical protein FOMPIDRAFT_134295 [Fomitopsis schrenkii]|uniref:25S rRNA adenine-N(1) methyltransferase n=1 Tax=Fomitopsis schrenkii TaxID=2126942 RepID=S8ENZ9_FOMSC|nr:hypothetical protein FOMPIDRAFT_134295 [Fomitopsis schrenkii]
MPKAHKRTRKLPVTVIDHRQPHATTSTASSSKPAATRTVIRRFHVLIKRKAQLEKAIRQGEASVDGGDPRAALRDVEQEIEELGGLGAYQRMSSIGQGSDRGGGSERVLIDWLKELGAHGTAKEAKKRLLEVGALLPDNYASCSSWIENTPIDLRSRHPSIREQDFLLMDEDANREKWDVISLSLVVNFVPEARDRGEMLSSAYSMLRHEGLLFLALPLPCIMNSRYLTPEHLDGLVQAIGFTIVKTRWKIGGKMAYWLMRKAAATPSVSGNTSAYSKKTELRKGKRNNFAILL